MGAWIAVLFLPYLMICLWLMSWFQRHNERKIGRGNLLALVLLPFMLPFWICLFGYGVLSKVLNKPSKRR
jgi:hypothetical protein